MRVKIIATGARIATVVRAVTVQEEAEAIAAARAEAERLAVLDPNVRVSVYRNAGCKGLVLLGAWHRGAWIAA